MTSSPYLGNAEPADPFHPRHFEAVRQPREAATTLPGWCYTSQAFYERERETIFLRQWNCIGHHSRVPDKGSYLAFDFMGIPVVVVRGNDGQPRAFVNACSHRGAPVASGSGQDKHLKCPYHSWAFSLEGELIGTPKFEEHAHFRKSDHGLRPIRLEQWAGLMWINFDSSAPGLYQWLGDLPERTAPWKPEEMVCVARTTKTIHANWKHQFENFSDTYHVPFVHKASLNFLPVRGREIHDKSVHRGNYVMHAAWFAGTRAVLPGQPIFEEIEGLPEDLHGTFYPWIYPNAGMAFNVDHIWVIEMYPEGPERYSHSRSFLVRKSELERPGFDEVLHNYVENAEIVNREDVAIIESLQRAVRSPAYRPGRFADMDKLVYGCQQWVLDHVVGGQTASPLKVVA